VLVVSVSGLSGCYLDTSPAGPDAVSLQLAELLNDKDPVVRRTAAESLGKIGSSSQIERVVQTLSDPDPHVREAGVVALGRLEVEADGVPAIVQALGDTAGPVRAAAARSLGEVGDVSGVANVSSGY
jgi:HEAT repeat protein